MIKCDTTPHKILSAKKKENRRRFLKFSALSAVVFLTYGIQTTNAGYWANKERKIKLRNLWTNEKISVVYWQDGKYINKALQTINNLLRDWRTGEVGEIFYQLPDHLIKIATFLDADAEFDVISGFRSTRTNSWLAGNSEGVSINSLHTIGMAIDIRHPKISTKELFIAGKKLELGGVGYYKESDFVHIDVGPSRTWIKS
ncbi:MAG: Twin-arginine translocation pathway signal [Rhodospirillaceae bacterium]|mgnify:CR=1 FL=1|nr:Twin-arginine translocation pathway signal [Rhodospirillaceae bacterium]|tara:strand:- start:27605 stop:28204 length:600 start_codon:yes stop_codon:yes gene_type:complete